MGNESCGTILKNLRQNSGESLRSFANKIGISGSHISEYENSTRKPTLRVLLLYSEYFSVPLDYLVGKYEYPESIDKKIQNDQELDALASIQRIFHDRGNDEYKKMELLLFSSLYQSEWGSSLKHALYNYINNQDDIAAEEILLKELKALKRLRNENPEMESWEYTLIARNSHE